MNIDRKVVEQALAALEVAVPYEYQSRGYAPITALRQALEQPKREWVGLTHEEIDYQAKKDDHAVYFALGALWAEAKLKEKNT
jgi:hypothetical protein